MLFHAFQCWLSDLSARWRAARRRARPQARRGRWSPLQLEELEPRVVPAAVVSYIGPAGGN